MKKADVKGESHGQEHTAVQSAQASSSTGRREVVRP
jgi:hypothetical protein